MKSLKESLLTDIEDTLKSGDSVSDEMFRLNYRFTHYNTVMFRYVPGGKSGFIKKYFGNKLESIPACMNIPFIDYNRAKKFEKKYNKPLSWFEAIILNTIYDEPIDKVLIHTPTYPYKIIDDKLEYEFNSRLLPEYRKLYENGNPIIRTNTKWTYLPKRTIVSVAIYLTSNILKIDEDAIYGKICEIDFLYYDDDKKPV